MKALAFKELREVFGIAVVALGGYLALVLSTVATGFLGFGVWVHHMFATGLPQMSESFFHFFNSRRPKALGPGIASVARSRFGLIDRLGLRVAHNGSVLLVRWEFARRRGGMGISAGRTQVRSGSSPGRSSLAKYVQNPAVNRARLAGRGAIVCGF